MSVLDSPPVDALVERIVKEYEFESITAERELSGGMFARPLLFATDRGRFVHRLHTFRNTEPAFRFQAEVINAVWQQDVRCSRVEPTRRGEWSLPVSDGVGIAALHHFLDGSGYDWTTWHHKKHCDDGFLHSLGCQVAELQNALGRSMPGGERNLSTALPPIQFRYLDRIRRNWREVLEELRRERPHSISVSRDQFLSLAAPIERHWERLSSAMQRGGVNELPTQIVHGDISPVNMVFDSDDRVAFIDWDCVHVGHRLYDALGDVLNRSPDEHAEWNLFDTEEVNVYIDGYASRLEMPLTAGERRLIPAFCLARQLEDLRQRLAVLPRLRAAEDERYANLIRMRVEMMDQIELN